METVENGRKESLLKKIISDAFGVLMVLVVLSLPFCFYCTYRCVRGHFKLKEAYKNEAKQYEVLCGNVGVMRLDREHVRTVNLRDKKPISPKIKWISAAPKRDSLTVFCDRKGKRGFLNVNTGKIELEGRFERAWVFSEGLAAVVEEEAGLLGFIGHDGEYVIPPSIRYDPIFDYIFKGGYCWIRDDNNRYWAIDKTGSKVTEPVFNFVGTSSSNAFVVRAGDRYGLVDSTMRWLLKPDYDGISICSEKERTVYLMKNNIRQKATYDGTVLEPFVIDATGPLQYYHNSEEDLSKDPDFLWFRVDDKMGVMDARSAKVILPAAFTDVEMASPDIFECELEDNYYQNVLFDLKGRPLGETLVSSLRSE